MWSLNVCENDDLNFECQNVKLKSEKNEIEAKKLIRQSVGENDIQLLVNFVCLDKM